MTQTGRQLYGRLYSESIAPQVGFGSMAKNWACVEGPLTSRDRPWPEAQPLAAGFSTGPNHRHAPVRSAPYGARRLSRSSSGVPRRRRFTRFRRDTHLRLLQSGLSPVRVCHLRGEVTVASAACSQEIALSLDGLSVVPLVGVPVHALRRFRRERDLSPKSHPASMNALSVGFPGRLKSNVTPYR